MVDKVNGWPAVKPSENSKEYEEPCVCGGYPQWYCDWSMLPPKGCLRPIKEAIKRLK